eukprot:COSAG02_NODE_6983_length_3248_cov_209.588441_4_plen_72_part_00
MSYGKIPLVQGIHYESTQVDSYMYNDSVLYRGTVQYDSTGTIGNRFGSYVRGAAIRGREERGWGTGCHRPR